MDPLTSKPFGNKFALIIPTRNRPEILLKLLGSIQMQDVLPDQTIIVDGSDLPIRSRIEAFFPDNTIYVHCFPPSLTKQRNAGLAHLDKNITLIGYLDDDIELEPAAVQALLSFFETAPADMGGASFNIINVPPKKKLITFIRKLFLIDGDVPGKVLKSGFCTSIFPMDADVDCNWLCGGATVWRRELFKTFSFDEWFAGWAYHEDADFSYRVSKHYRLAGIHSAKVTHNPPPFNKTKQKQLGMMAVINRYYFVTKNKELSVLFFFWASFGEILINILQSIRDLDGSGFLLAAGNITGLYRIIKGDMVQVDVNFRKQA
ncbi:glycosyltransferase family 2 protein [Methanoregula sp.]|uniref:glycosyltransferase family 2 protein n=1 Tax=Methanoregula sp. TaxID=2052170 RepID=UPI0035631530